VSTWALYGSKTTRSASQSQESERSDAGRSLLAWLEGQHQLRLRHHGHAAVVGVADDRLPDHGVATDMQRRGFADQVGSAPGRQKVRLRFNGGLE